MDLPDDLRRVTATGFETPGFAFATLRLCDYETVRL
jgi:hypothetical protein